jgi:hypothetical protein
MPLCLLITRAEELTTFDQDLAPKGFVRAYTDLRMLDRDQKGDMVGDAI